jgi:hypothetical protein
MISHAIPGRIRLRHTSPLSQTDIDDLALRIRELAPSAVLEHDPRTLGTLILFEEKEAGSGIADLVGAGQERAAAPACTPRDWSVSRWLTMRRVKRGMAVSLTASLALLAARREDGHALAGGVFLALLGRHVWVYRKRLWK